MNASYIFKNKGFWLYILRFGIIFCILYFGTMALIGIISAEGYYNLFIDHYFIYIDWLRYSLLHASKGLLSLFNYATALEIIYI